ncbi:hypothetical protein BMS3Abin17_00008 [archaeon BMS3Abin17]|nr:hypothetical protein BMS3Abin17_00008 [archaeon BMS3Abin17]
MRKIIFVLLVGIFLVGLVNADITTDCSDVVALYHFDVQQIRVIMEMMG